MRCSSKRRSFIVRTPKMELCASLLFTFSASMACWNRACACCSATPTASSTRYSVDSTSTCRQASSWSVSGMPDTNLATASFGWFLLAVIQCRCSCGCPRIMSDASQRKRSTTTRVLRNTSRAWCSLSVLPPSCSSKSSASLSDTDKRSTASSRSTASKQACSVRRIPRTSSASWSRLQYTPLSRGLASAYSTSAASVTISATTRAATEYTEARVRERWCKDSVPGAVSSRRSAPSRAVTAENTATCPSSANPTAPRARRKRASSRSSSTASPCSKLYAVHSRAVCSSSENSSASGGLKWCRW
mmetsp:Transcript_16635/g.45709  ORF Transcript_16635/g.45709 Transcript_16635/m.45709 type:complete len:303 (-) Transcript_16635:213-1121(-)